MVSAGEASGDTHAAHALDALRSIESDVVTFGMGGEKLQSAGTELIIDFSDLSVIGFVDVLLNYHKFLKRLKTLRHCLRERAPDLLFLVDFPDFNLKLAETAKELGIPVLFYVSPQIWAWRPGRIHRIGSLVSHMAVLFPFEVSYYENENIPVSYVGNPLVDDAISPFSRAEARDYLKLESSVTTVGLLPGSRIGELHRILPIMLEAAALLSERYENIQFVLPKAATLDADDIASIVSRQPMRPTVTEGEAGNVMRACDVVICASGTATLECALIGTPTVLVYKVSRINYEIMRRLIQIKDIGLVNIVAGRRIVPELVQHDATGTRILHEVASLLDNPTQTESMRAEMAIVKEKMGRPGASIRVAELIVQMLAETNPTSSTM